MKLCRAYSTLIFLVWIAPAFAQTAPAPMLKKGHPVDWWFAFKFNAGVFPGCGGTAVPACIFGGTPQKKPAGQQFVFASSENQALQSGSGCAGDTTSDPIGATFDQIYHGDYNYVIWNDQFYDDPVMKGCTNECGSPWGHSKGVIAWNSAGNGVVMQVSTPSWPASGGPAHARKDGNTLGCISDDNVEVSQHFFALKLSKADLVQVLTAMQNANVVTDPANPQLVRNGGPADVKALVAKLGTRSAATTPIKVTLSSGVVLISKPSNLNVPPWQMVSALLGGVSLRTATWWMHPAIPSTTASTEVACWSPSLGKAGAVEIATTGTWSGKTFGLTGGGGPNFNHAKIGVSTSTGSHFAIFGDMNQQGSLSGPHCNSSQNGRGGLFYVVDNAKLAGAVTALIAGSTAPTQ